MKEEKVIYEYLKRYHRGREKAVCSNELERLFCLTGRSLRRRIASLRQSGFPICSCASGYYYPTTLQDVNATMSWLNELVYGVSNAKAGLARSCAQFSGVKVRLSINEVGVMR